MLSFVATMHKAIHTTGLKPNEKAFLARIERNLPITADLSRADVLLYVQTKREFVIVSQARPHSMAPIYRQDVVGTGVGGSEAGQIERTFATGRVTAQEVQRWGDRAPFVRRTHPVCGPDGRVVGVLSIETNLIEYARHRRRQPAFRRALAVLQEAALCQEITGVEDLIPFGEQDGIVLVDPQRRIRYLSGIATSFYRKLGYMDSLVGQDVGYLETGDDELVGMSLSQRRCFRSEARVQEREWIRQTLPIFAVAQRWQPLRRFIGRQGVPGVHGVLLMVHDETEMRRRQRELQVKSTMIQETHHRVKNNLQTIAALLRMEARRTNSEEAKRVLEESLNRILSIAVVHEFMADHGDRLINLREVGQHLVSHMRQMLIYPDRQISVYLSGPDIYLPSQQATVCSLVMNELLQNAIEHGFSDRTSGSVSLRLAEAADRVIVEVSDNGAGLPNDFDLQRDGSVGLNIVQVLVRDDLKGQVTFASGEGVTATVTFPKFSAEVGQSGTD